MFNKLWEENGIPAGAFASFTAGLKKESTIHPHDLAVGALIGGSYAAHNAYKKHKTLPGSKETTYSNKLRHELEHHLETRQNKDNPGFTDRIKERLIRSRLRYANAAQGHPMAAMAAEGAVGAAAGALYGHTVGKAIRGSTTMSLAKRSSALQVVDTLGLSREMLHKKAEYLGTTVEEVADMELAAYTISQLPTKTAAQQDFLTEMHDIQQSVSDLTPTLIRPLTLSTVMQKAAANGLEGSIGELLIKREMNKELAREVPSALAESAASQIEPNDYREPARNERGRELMGIFGGPSEEVDSEKVSYIFGADEPDAVSSRSGGVFSDSRKRMLRDYYKKKSKEEHTPYGKSIGIGALIGGGIGAVGGVGGAIGGALGGGAIGALLTAQDKAEIRKAKSRLNLTDEQVEDLISRKVDARIRSERDVDNWRSERRHNELMSALKKR